MSRALYLAALELRRHLADRGELAFGFALPVALFVLMYASFSGGASFTGTVYVVDSDRGPVTAQILDRLDDVEGLTVEVLTEQEATDKLDRSAILSAVVFPAGFSEQVSSGAEPTAIVRQRGNGGQSGQITTNMARSVASGVVAEQEARAAIEAAAANLGVAESRASETAELLLARSTEDPIVSVESQSVGGSSDFVDRLFPGILVMFMLFAVTLSSRSIIEDRRLGTLERLMTTRLTLGQMFTGRFLAGVLRALLQTLVLLSLGFAVLRVAGPEQYFQTLIFCLLICATVSSIGLAIGALCTNNDQAVWASLVITMFMTVFGGTFFPVSVGVLDAISYATINRHAIDAMHSIISGDANLTAQWLQAAVLGGVALAALALARWGFRASDR